MCCNPDGTINKSESCCKDRSANEKAGAWAQYMHRNQDTVNVDFYLKNRNADVNKPDGYWRCNIFVWDAYRKGADISSESIPLAPGTKWPAYANNIADPSFESDLMPIVEKAKDLEPGDIVAWPQQGDSGHVGIVGCDGKIYNAGSDKIKKYNPVFGTSNFFYHLKNRDPVYRSPIF